jgi:vesicle-fusing ATPase
MSTAKQPFKTRVQPSAAQSAASVCPTAASVGSSERASVKNDDLLAAAPTRPILIPSPMNNVLTYDTIKPLSVGQQPENRLAYTNCVFVHPDEKTAYPKGASASNFLTLKGHVFAVQPHPAQAAGTIGLNKLQRESCQLTEGDMVSPTVFQLPTTDVSFNLYALRLEFDTYGTGNKRLTFKEDEMLPKIKEVFAGQVFTKGQMFWSQFASYAIIFTVKSMEGPIKEEKDQLKHGSITKPVPQGLFSVGTKVKLSVKADRNQTLTLEESDERPPIFDPDWSFADMGIGGLDLEFNQIFRRAFASRLFPPVILEQLGLKHVKGMLLHGPPGTGKTLIARQIGKLLKGREPKVVNGPEVLSKFVGKSEENVRDLFKDAEVEQLEKKDKSSLHIIIFDEIDAICRTRGTMTGSTGVHDTVVNQLLSKIDGVNQLNNILVIGMTNRKDMIDPALLRPGRLEIHVEIVRNTTTTTTTTTITSPSPLS